MPLFEPFVRARWAHYDSSLLGGDGFCHAHITVLGPVEPNMRTRGEIARLAARTRPLEVRVDDVFAFPNGVIAGSLSPEGPLRALTRALSVALDTPAYAGAFEPRPHVTLDAVGPGVSVESVRDAVAPLLGVPVRLGEVVLAWYRAGETRTLERWPLEGVGGSAASCDDGLGPGEIGA